MTNQIVVEENPSQNQQKSLIFVLILSLLISVGFNIILLSIQAYQSSLLTNLTQDTNQVDDPIPNTDVEVPLTQTEPTLAKTQEDILIPMTTEITLSIPNGTLLKQPATGEPVWNNNRLAEKYVLEINNEIYTLGINAGGLCPWDPGDPDFVDETNCTYTNKALKNAVVNIPTFRIWNDNKGVFALNPQSVTVDENYLDFFSIQKESADPIFSEAEVTFWEQTLLNNLVSSQP